MPHALLRCSRDPVCRMSGVYDVNTFTRATSAIIAICCRKNGEGGSGLPSADLQLKLIVGIRLADSE